MIIAADVHYGLSSDSVPTEDGVPSKIRWTMERLKVLAQAAVKEPDKTLVIAGDIFNSSDPSSFIFSTFLDFLAWTAELEVVVLLIPGNHDCGFDWAATEVVRSSSFSNVFTYTEPDIVDTSVGNILLVPHMPGWRDDVKLMDRLRFMAKERKPTVGIAHGQFSLDYKHGSEDSLEAGNAMVFNPLELVRICPHWYIGHIHAHQDLMVGSVARIHIPGSIITNDFAEVGQRKGYYVVRRGKTPLFRMFPDGDWQYTVLDVDLRTLDRPYEKSLKERLRGNMLKVRLKVPEGEVHERLAVRAALEALGAHVCRIETEIIRKRASSLKSQKKGAPVHFELNHSALLKAFLAKTDLAPADRILAQRTGEEIIQECLKP